jgi:tetratricopeptide (TPR) repeat protein
MRQGTCSQCDMTTSIRSFYSLNGKVYCEPCVWKAARELKEAGQPAEYVALADNSICGRCGAYSGDTSDHPIVAKIPLCGTCAPQVMNWPYPAWLKTGLAVLLVLLVVSLMHGRKYFHAGRTMYRGEQLVENRQYAEALPYLQETLRIAPESDKAVLLTAKAALLSGEFQIADKAIQGHNAGHFADANDSDFLEVQGIWNRATQAFDKATEASKLEQQDGHAAEAARLMHEAASLYPEAVGLAIAAETYDEGTAYESKDYDTFLKIAQKQWKEHSGPGTAAVVSSALACKFAITGEVLYRQQSEEMLENARRLTPSDEEQQKAFREYAERITYRLTSREIISKQEYDRRFRSGKTEPK